MSLTIFDTIIDEEFRTPSTGTADEHEVPSLSPGVGAALDVVTDPADFITSPPGFPQYAEKTNFVSSTNQVTDYFLGDADGDPLVAVATTLYVGSNQVFLYSTGDPNIVVGRVGSGTTADANGDIALVIAIEETVTGGFVTAADMWLGLYAPLVQDGNNLVDSADELDLSGLIHLGSDFSTQTEVPFENYASVPSGQDAFALVGPTSGSSVVDLLVTGFAGTTVSTVNVSTQGLGSGQQSVDEGESLRIDIVDANAADFANADEPSEVHDAVNISYAGGHQSAVAMTFEIEQTNPNKNTATVSVFAYNTATNFQGTDFPTNAISSPGTLVQIDVEDVVILDAAGNPITAAFLARGGTITALDGNNDGTLDGVKVSGLLAHEQVKFSTDGAVFNRVVLTNSDATTGPDTWDLGAVKVTVLQGGSDTEFAELGSHLRFQDDGPLIDPSGSAAPTLTVDDSNFALDDTDDFSGLFGAPDYGADGAGTLQYALGISSTGASSGLIDTATGNTVFLFLESGVVVGREGTNSTTAAGGAEVFRISVDASGDVTLDQSRAVKHVDANDHNSSTGLSATPTNLITLSATVFDSEASGSNDSDSATVNIGDAFDFFDDGPVITGQPAGSLTPNDLVVKNETDSDGQDSSSYTLTSGNDGFKSFTIVGPADTTGDFTWAYSDTDGIANNEVTGSYKGSPLYTLKLENDGDYVFTMIGTLPSSPRDLNPLEIKAGGPDTNFIDVGLLVGSDFVRIAGGGGAINESNAFVGVANGNLDAGESLTFSLHEADGSLITFEGINIGTKSAQASSYNWVATLVGGGTDSGTENVSKNGTIVIDPIIDLQGATVESITITKVSGSATKIGIGDIEILVPPDDVVLPFSVRLTDGDDDYADASFSVSIDGNNDGSITSPITALSAFGQGDLLL